MPYAFRERRLEYLKEWRLRNPDYGKQHALKTVELHKKSRSKRYKVNKLKYIESVRNYQKANSLKVTTWKRNRKSLKRGAEGRHTERDIINLYNKQSGLCNGCDCLLIDFHVDHIIPLSRGGSNWPSNLQLLCPPCNLSKSDKTMEEWNEYKQMVGY